MHARVGDIERADAPAVISVRPERVLLDGAAQTSENRFTVPVQEIIYLGDHIRVRVDLAGNTNFMIKSTVSQWDHRIKVGDSIDLGIDSAHARALVPILSPT